MEVSAISFTGKDRYTQKGGNPYKKTNVSKLAGIGVGVAASGGCWLHKIKKIDKKIIMKDLSKEGRLYFKSVKEFLRNPKIVAGLAAAGVVVGLAGGAIVDGIVNSVRRHKADKAAQKS